MPIDLDDPEMDYAICPNCGNTQPDLKRAMICNFCRASIPTMCDDLLAEDDEQPDAPLEGLDY